MRKYLSIIPLCLLAFTCGITQLPIPATAAPNDRELAELNQAIQLNPKNAAAYLDRGAIYYLQKQSALALADYNQAIQLDPKNAEAYVLRGGIYHQRQQYALALADCTQAIQLNPQQANAYALRAAVYIMQDRYDRAIPDLENAARLYRAQNDLQNYPKVMELLRKLKAANR